MARFALFTVFAWAGVASAAPPTFDRTIAKEPVYETKAPKYCLLAFGPQGKERVWLVLDGDALYVDRNGNADLNEPGEKVRADKKAGNDADEEGYRFEVGELSVGGRKHTGLSVWIIPLKLYANGSLGKRAEVKAALAKDPKTMTVRLVVDVDVPGIKGGGVGGRIAYQVGPIDLGGVFQFAATPAAAPVVHLGGPLQVTFYSERPALRVGRSSELVLVVGTPGAGPGTFAMIEYQDTIPESAKPLAEISLPPAKAGAAPLTERFKIKSRC